MRIRPIFAWYDLWVGAFYDRAKRRLYIFPVPCFGFYVERATRNTNGAAAPGTPPGTTAPLSDHCPRLQAEAASEVVADLGGSDLHENAKIAGSCHENLLPLAQAPAKPTGDVTTESRRRDTTAALQTALVAMKIASALPGVADEYDFSDAIEAVTNALTTTEAGTRSNQTLHSFAREIWGEVWVENEWTHLQEFAFRVSILATPGEPHG